LPGQSGERRPGKGAGHKRLPTPLSTIRKILLTQLLANALLAVALWIWQGAGAAGSVLLGGVICVIPNAFLAARIMFSPAATTSPQRLMRAAWMGEIGKLLLTGALFVAVFVTVKPPYPGLVFAGFIIAQGGMLAGLLLRDRVESTA